MYFNMPSHIEFGTLVKSADYSEIAFYRTYPTFFQVQAFRAVFTWLSKGIGFGFGFTTPFGWLVYLLWFWFYDSQVKTALSNR